MKIHYTRRALAQIDDTLTFIEARSPQGVAHVQDRILALVSLLQERPYAGRATSRANVRRLPTSPYPYLIDYRVSEKEIVIYAISPRSPSAASSLRVRVLILTRNPGHDSIRPESSPDKCWFRTPLSSSQPGQGNPTA